MGGLIHQCYSPSLDTVYMMHRLCVMVTLPAWQWPLSAPWPRAASMARSVRLNVLTTGSFHTTAETLASAPELIM
jgi:hypothetical protein